MITTVVRIDFANSSVSLRDDDDIFNDLLEAVDHANINLRARHKANVEVSCIDFPKNYFVVFEITAPFWMTKPGRHLKGVSSYLLKNYPSRYENLRVGTRLLKYTVIGRVDHSSNE